MATSLEAATDGTSLASGSRSARPVRRSGEVALRAGPSVTRPPCHAWSVQLAIRAKLVSYPCPPWG